MSEKGTRGRGQTGVEANLDSRRATLRKQLWPDDDEPEAGNRTVLIGGVSDADYMLLDRAKQQSQDGNEQNRLSERSRSAGMTVAPEPFTLL